MATAGLVMTQTSQPPNDLHQFTPRSNLERFFYHGKHTQRQPLKELDPSGHLATDFGVTKREIGYAKRQAKQETHHTSSVSRFRAKAKPVKAFAVDTQGIVCSQGRDKTPGTPTAANRSSSGPAEACARCVAGGTCDCTSGTLWLPIGDTGNALRSQNLVDRKQILPNRRGMVKRSVSAVSDLIGHHSNGGGHSTSSSVVQSSVKSSCFSGQRLAKWRDQSRFDADDCSDVTSKRLSLVEPRTRTPSGKMHVDEKGANESANIGEFLTILGGSPYVGREAEAPTDRSPLIEFDRSPFAAAKNSFDNVAATDSSGYSRISGQNTLGGGQLDPSHVLPIRKPEGESTLRQPPPTPRTVEAKKKWFPALRVKIPDNESSSGSSSGPKLKLKKLSAADERKIEEALELAGTFGRLGTSDNCPSTPRTPGASSKESRESLASSSDSPTSHFRFNFFKGRKEEKKTFAEELAAQLTDPSSLLTPESLEAYEKLVSKGSSEAVESDAKNRLSRQSSRQTHRSSIRTRTLQRNHRNRNSLSESDKAIVVENSAAPTKSTKTGSRLRRLMRFASTGGTLDAHKTHAEQNMFAWFEKNPLNVTKPELTGRPKSLQSDLGNIGEMTFPLSMPRQQSLELQLPPRGGKGKKVEGARRQPPPIPPPASGDPEPPPAIPPRIPRRQFTTNATGHSKPHKLPQSSWIKPRSYSEGVNTVHSTRSNLYDIPRRHIRSTETSDGASILSEPRSPSPHNLASSLHGSDDSVFDTIPRSPRGPIPSVRDPGLVSSRGIKHLGPYRSMSVKNVKVKAKELGISDKNDPFWDKNVTLDLSESHSESDLLREALAPIPGRYETSDCISYEDLMEFALDGPQRNRNDDADFAVCDEIRLMRKMFSNDVTIEDCQDSLVETGWNIHNAVKLIKLKQLLATELGTQDQCKEALMARNWNVHEAATFLLAPPTNN